MLRIQRFTRLFTFCHGQIQYSNKMVNCAISGCTASSGTRSIDKLSLFRFPPDKRIMDLWIAKINRPDFTLKRHSCVCSRHFEDSCFEVHPLVAQSLPPHLRRTPRLKQGSVPTKNLPDETKEPEEREGNPQNRAEVVSLVIHKRSTASRRKSARKRRKETPTSDKKSALGDGKQQEDIKQEPDADDCFTHQQAITEPSPNEFAEPPSNEFSDFLEVVVKVEQDDECMPELVSNQHHSPESVKTSNKKFDLFAKAMRESEAELPENWNLLVSSDTVMLVYSTSKCPLVIQRQVNVTSDWNVEVYVHGIRLADHHFFWKRCNFITTNINYMTVKTAKTEILRFATVLSEYKMCCGNFEGFSFDSQEVGLSRSDAVARNWSCFYEGDFLDFDLSGCQYSHTIRSVDCDLLVDVNLRCEGCCNARKTLKSRKQDPEIIEDSETLGTYMSKKELIARIRTLTSERNNPKGQKKRRKGNAAKKSRVDIQDE